MEDVPQKITFRDKLTLSSQILAQTLQTIHDSNAVILSQWAVFSSISLPPQILPISTSSISTNGKQDILKQPVANMDLLYFSAWSYYKSSVEKNFPIFAVAFSH